MDTSTFKSPENFRNELPCKPSPLKAAVTEFRVLKTSSDGLSSIVECRLLTGRTHQIRAHLAYCGHPIATDALYGGEYAPVIENTTKGKENLNVGVDGGTTHVAGGSSTCQN